jgi:hypothetical protein
MLVGCSMTDLELARKPEPQLTPDATFLAEILAALLVLTIFTGGVVFVLL